MDEFVKIDLVSQEYEKGGFRNVRCKDGQVISLCRVLRPEHMEQNNADPFVAFNERMSRRRVPRSAPPTVDFILEAGRLLCYPHMPSRQRSLFANLGGYQPGYVKNGFKPYLILPHESAKISISSILDFKVPNPEELCEYATEQFKSIFKGETFEAARFAVNKLKFLDEDYEHSHRLLELLDLLQKWFTGEPGNFPELDYLLRFWRESVLVRGMICPEQRFGNEVVIEGAVYYVDITP